MGEERLPFILQIPEHLIKIDESKAIEVWEKIWHQVARSASSEVGIQIKGINFDDNHENTAMIFKLFLLSKINDSFKSFQMCLFYRPNEEDRKTLKMLNHNQQTGFMDIIIDTYLPEGPDGKGLPGFEQYGARLLLNGPKKLTISEVGRRVGKSKLWVEMFIKKGGMSLNYPLSPDWRNLNGMKPKFVTPDIIARVAEEIVSSPYSKWTGTRIQALLQIWLEGQVVSSSTARVILSQARNILQQHDKENET